MNAGSFSQMTTNNFTAQNAMALPGGNLASRRGGQNPKGLSIDTMRQGASNDNGVPTPRTSRSHLLAGLRTAPKSATATSFGPMSPAAGGRTQAFGRTGEPNAQDLYNGPKSAYPQYGNHQGFQSAMNQQNYTVDQVLAPPQLAMDDQAQEQMDPNLYAQLVATNLYLAQQQQRLQQQLMSVQSAAQQFQQLNLNNPQLAQQQMALYEQQQQLRNMQQQLGIQAALGQGQQVFYDPSSGQYFVSNATAPVQNNVQYEQPVNVGYNAYQQTIQQQQQQQQYSQTTPRVQVSPPPENQPMTFRTNSPPKRYESPVDVAPLPPPSANAFRRGHKKSSSLTPVNSALAAATGGDSAKSAGPKTASFPLTPLTGGYGPGQARAGEHPIRQPRGPPSLDELKAKPTAKHEGSKNFAARTRRSAVHNLVRAGLERRKGTGSSAGSMSPVSETAEDVATPITDNESDSGRSGSGSLAGEMECSSSRTSASGSWGAIGSDRPGSRQNTRGSVDSAGSMTSVSESDGGSFANVFKHGALRAQKQEEASTEQRKAPRLVLTSVEKRKTTPVV